MRIYTSTSVSCSIGACSRPGECALLHDHARYDLNVGKYRDFKEALVVTARAKAGFPGERDDLLRRGRSLVVESVAAGVTAMRAHVEVDDTVGLVCLEAGLQLKEEMKEMCRVQIAGTMGITYGKVSCIVLLMYRYPNPWVLCAHTQRLLRIRCFRRQGHRTRTCSGW
jgi:hypothetical protein